MKKYLFILLAAMTFTACGDDEEEWNPIDESEDSFVVEDLPPVSDFKFVQNENNEWEPEGGLQPFTKSMFEEYIQRRGWKHVASHEILADGTVKAKGYYEDLMGGSPINYYFGKNSLTEFGLSDADPTNPFYFHNYKYNYSEDRNEIFSGFSILSYDQDKHVLIILHKTYYKCILEFYHRMDKTQLENICKRHGTSIKDISK